MQPFQFKKTLIRHLKKYLHSIMLKLTKHCDVQNFYSEILNFCLFFAKKSQFSGPACFLWRHNYVTPWPIVLILVCMNREGSYLPIDTKINFIKCSVRKIYGGLQHPPWLDVLQKIAWLDEGCSVVKKIIIFECWLELVKHMFSWKIMFISSPTVVPRSQGP